MQPKLNFKVQGTGNPLLILHGLFGSLDNWQGIAKSLSTDFKVYTIDLRNHGRSPHFPSHQYAEIAEDIRQFLIDEGEQKVSLLGHSMGGKAAMHFALHFRESINRLVVADIGVKKYSGGHDSILSALQTFEVEKIESRAAAEAQMAAKIKDVGTIQFILKNLVRKTDGNGFEWKMNLPVLLKSYEKIVGETIATATFVEPTLFLRGSRSDYILENDIPGILKLFPKAQIKTIPNAGHWLHADQPQLLKDELLKFLI